MLGGPSTKLASYHVRHTWRASTVARTFRFGDMHGLTPLAARMSSLLLATIGFGFNLQACCCLRIKVEYVNPHSRVHFVAFTQNLLVQWSWVHTTPVVQSALHQHSAVTALTAHFLQCGAYAFHMCTTIDGTQRKQGACIHTVFEIIATSAI